MAGGVAAYLAAGSDKVVTQLLSGSRSAQVAAKHLLRGRSAPDAAVALDAETARISSAAGSPDGREGVRAFLDKRPPRWSMRPSADMPEFLPPPRTASR